MQKSTTLSELLSQLTLRARALNLSDSAWAARAGLRKETLSRLRSRETCDFQSLAALAQALGMRVGLLDKLAAGIGDMQLPELIDRDYEERLVELAVSGALDLERWAACGPRFFMAGLAVMLASEHGFDRRGLLELAERLHTGASETEVFQRWLVASPVKPSRFLPLVRASRRDAA